MIMQNVSVELLRSLYSTKLETGGVRPIDTIGINRFSALLEAIIDPANFTIIGSWFLKVNLVVSKLRRRPTTLNNRIEEWFRNVFWTLNNAM